MEVDKPQGEECGNCKFCRSEIAEVPFQMFKHETTEYFSCHRYPEIRYKPKTGWCGEWRERKGNQNGN
jgi:hypothetical protein